MEFLVFFICLILVGYSYVKKNADTPEMRQKQYNEQVGGSYVSSDKPNNQYMSSVNRQAAIQSLNHMGNSVYSGNNTTPVNGSYSGTIQPTRKVMTDEQRKKLEAYRKKKTANNTYSAVVKSEPESIIELAKNNIEEIKQENVREELTKELIIGTYMPDMDLTSTLGDVNDLIVKGYDGNMEFERDFIGEAMDMLNSYTMCSTQCD